MDGNSHADTEPSDESTDESNGFDATRREYLQTAAGAAAGFAAAGVVPDAVGAASYDTITVGQGERRTITLADGETFENKLVDITADGAAVLFDATANDWTIRNVGVKGAQSQDATFAHMSVPDSGSSGLVENFYIGDGTDVCPSDVTGTWVDATDADAHRGTLTFRNVNVQGFSDNGLYGSGPGTQLGPDEGGEVIIEDSFAKNNNISSFRIGTNGSRIRNSVVHVTDGSDICAYTGDDVNARGCWAREGATDLRIENCDIKVPDFDAVQINENTSLTIADSRIEGNIDNRGNLTRNNVSGNPDTTPPDCVPQTPEEAASATSCDGGGDVPDSGTITFEGGSTASDYRLGAGTDLVGQSNVDSEDSVHANATAEGVVQGGNDSFDYFGGITFCNVRGGDATVSVDGSQVDPDSLGELPNTVSVDSTDSNNPTDYTLSVSDQLEKSTHNGATVDPDDTIADGTATGTVQGGADSYRFSGEITSFDYSGGSFVLYVDGQQTDPDSVGSGPTVLDDFEDGDASEYAGQTSDYEVQSSTTLEGSHTLEATGTYGEIAHADETTPRGYEYRCRVEAASGSGAEPALLACVQNASDPMDDAYMAHADASSGEFRLNRREGGSLTILDSASHAFQEATEYELALELGTDTVKAVLYDASGTVVAETAAVSDSSHSGGTVGFYTGGGAPAYYDYVTKTSL